MVRLCCPSIQAASLPACNRYGYFADVVPYPAEDFGSTADLIRVLAGGIGVRNRSRIPQNHLHGTAAC